MNRNFTIPKRLYKTFVPSQLYIRHDNIKPNGSGFYKDTIDDLVSGNITTTNLPNAWPKGSRYLTRPKQMIINEIGYEVRNLQNNIFLDKSGTCS